MVCMTYIGGLTLTLTPASSMFSLLDYHVETAQIQDNDATALLCIFTVPPQISTIKTKG